MGDRTVRIRIPAARFVEWTAVDEEAPADEQIAELVVAVPADSELVGIVVVTDDDDGDRTITRSTLLVTASGVPYLHGDPPAAP